MWCSSRLLHILVLYNSELVWVASADLYLFPFNLLISFSPTLEAKQLVRPPVCAPMTSLLLNLTTVDMVFALVALLWINVRAHPWLQYPIKAIGMLHSFICTFQTAVLTQQRKAWSQNKVTELQEHQTGNYWGSYTNTHTFRHTHTHTGIRHLQATGAMAASS